MMSQADQIMDMFRDRLVLSSETIKDAGIHSQYVTALIKKRRIIRVSQGLYIKAQPHLLEVDKLAVVSRIAPMGTIGLLSALRFHKVLDEEPKEIYIAMPKKYKKPNMRYLNVHYFTVTSCVHYPGEFRYLLNDTEVWIHSVEKALVDCFRLPHIINHDIAVNALRIAADKKLIDYDLLWDFSRACSIANVMRPYVEILNGPVMEAYFPMEYHHWHDDDRL